jgi:hypothetical protein
MLSRGLQDDVLLWRLNLLELLGPLLLEIHLLLLILILYRDAAYLRLGVVILGAVLNSESLTMRLDCVLFSYFAH